MSLPTILVTNDDGINAPGIRELIQQMRPLGNIVVIAPDRPQSAMGHAVTIQTPLRLHKIHEEENYVEYSCNGTPVDCVKLGQKVLLRRNPNLIVSGINHGSNASINVIYSGTMAAVIEGAMEEIPAIGFSLNDYAFNADFSHCGKFIRNIVTNVLQHSLPQGVCLNVNIPAVPAKDIMGIMVARQSKAFWDEDFDSRTDPHHRDYYWLKGVFVNKDSGHDTDIWALENNYVSVVPVQIDLTAYHAIDKLKKWNFNTEN